MPLAALVSAVAPRPAVAGGAPRPRPAFAASAAASLAFAAASLAASCAFCCVLSGLVVCLATLEEVVICRFEHSSPKRHRP
eukprot:scaffold24564_cov30-Tisochrysis_lutea.AAC.1